MTANFPNFNASLYAVPAAWFLALTPRLYAVGAYKKASSAPKSEEVSKAPRGFSALVADDPTIDTVIRERIIRAEGASLNGLENLGFFAAAVVVGNAAGLDRTLLNRLSLGYIASRVAYNIIYINNQDKKSAGVRTAVYFISSLISSAFFVLSGLKANGNKA